jgi:hypothetical protein
VNASLRDDRHRSYDQACQQDAAEPPSSPTWPAAAAEFHKIVGIERFGAAAS